MKRVVILILAMVLVVSLLTSCAKPVPATPVPATPVPATPVPATPVPATPVAATPVAATPVPKPPFKVGLLSVLSGPQVSPDPHQGMMMFFDEVGWEVAGRKIVLIKEDDAFDPKTGLEKTRKLVESDRVDMLAGFVSSAVALAVRDYVHTHKVPTLLSAAAPTPILSFAQKSDYIFRVSYVSAVPAVAMAKYAYEQLGHRKVGLIAADYATGHECADAYKAVFGAAGGQVIQEVYVPLGTTDYAPYLATLKTADAVFAVFFAGDALKFNQQYVEFGLAKKMPRIGIGPLLDPQIIPAAGDAVLGVTVATPFPILGPFNTPESERFYTAYKKKYGHEPGFLSWPSYTGAKVIGLALEATKGDTTDPLKFVGAAKKLEFQSPYGLIKFEAETNSAILEMKIMTLEKKEGKLVGKELATIPGIAPSVIAPYVK